MWEIAAFSAGILGLLWVAFSRWRHGDIKAAAFWLLVAITAIIALIVITRLTQTLQPHFPANSTVP